MIKQLTENGWGDDPWLLRGGDKGAFANAALIVLAGALLPLSNRQKSSFTSILAILLQQFHLFYIFNRFLIDSFLNYKY